MPDYPPMPDYPATPDYPRDYPAAAGYPGYPPPAAQGAPEPGYPGYPENSRYPGQPGAAGPGGQSPNGHQPTAPPAPVSGPVTAPGPAIAHDEYAPGHEGYGVVPDHEGYGVVPDRGGAGHHGAGHHGLAPDEYGVVYDNYGLPGGPAEALPEAHGLPEPGAAGPGPAAAAQYDGPAAQYDGPAAQYDGPAAQYDGPAAQYDGPAARSGGSAARWAMLSYLTVPLFGFVVPLLVYLGSLRGSRWTRTHAAQALNVWITVFLYGLSALIMGTMLALDSPQIALIVFGPLVVALFAVMLTLLIRAAAAASKGEEYTIPRWLCSPIVR